MYTLLPLILSDHDWHCVADELENIEHQDNTHLLVDKLSKPLGEIFDLTNPYTVNQINQIKQTWS